MTPTLSSRGYYKVRLTDGPRREQGQVHRLVCLTFNGPPPEGKPLALHRDGNALNNSAENLYWGDSFDNMQDAVKHGVHRSASKTHCPEGHPYSGDNLKISKRGGRLCATCTQSNAKVLRTKYVEMGLEETDPRHGTPTGYTQYGCRCERCRESASAAVRAARKDRRLDPEDPRHGTATGYVNWNCRCDPCRAAERARVRKYGR